MEKGKVQTGDWSLLPSELLHSIAAEHLRLADIARLSAVCGGWAWALGSPQSRWPLPPPTTFTATSSLLEKSSPWLILPNKDGKDADYCDLLCPCESESGDSRVRISHLPEMVDRICVGGSPDGWIATVDVWLNLCILNPLTGEEFPLPPMGTLVDYNKMRPFYSQEGDGSICTVDHDQPLYDDMTWEEFKFKFVHKVILSSAPPHGIAFLMHASLSHFSYLEMARIGDVTWTSVLDLEDPEFSYEKIEDIVYNHNDHKFYVVSEVGKLIVLDLKNYQWGSSQFPEATVLRNLGGDRGYIPGEKYVVFSSNGDLLLVCRQYKSISESDSEDSLWSRDVREETFDIKIFKFDIGHYDGENSASNFVRLTDLGDDAIFIGFNYSTCISTATKKWLRRNSVYFAEDTICDQEYCQDYNARDAGIYDLKSDKVERFFLKDSKFSWPPPTWFIPQHF